MNFKNQKTKQLGNSTVETFKIPEELCLDKTLFKLLEETLKTKGQTVKIFGKESKRRCLQYGIENGSHYNYSRQTTKSTEWPQEIKEVLNSMFDFINKREKEFQFNGVLVNYYPDGEASISRHSDDEKGLKEGCPVYCFSFGSSRKVRFYKKRGTDIDSKKEPVKKLNSKLYEVSSGDCQAYVMGKNFQNEFEHEIPKEKGVTSPRISLTFRQHN